MRAHGKYAVVNPGNPSAFSICDRCGFQYNREDLVWQVEWAGQQLFSTGVLLCRNRCYDVPNEQLRTIILPPDPPPIINARPPDYTYEEAGPVQSTLTENVLQGAVLLPVVDATGFEVGNLVWVQLTNADYGQFELTAVGLNTNVLTIQAPLPAPAPYTGSVTVSIVGAA